MDSCFACGYLIMMRGLPTRIYSGRYCRAFIKANQVHGCAQKHYTLQHDYDDWFMCSITHKVLIHPVVDPVTHNKQQKLHHFIHQSFNKSAYLYLQI